MLVGWITASPSARILAIAQPEYPTIACARRLSFGFAAALALSVKTRCGVNSLARARAGGLNADYLVSSSVTVLSFRSAALARDKRHIYIAAGDFVSAMQRLGIPPKLGKGEGWRSQIEAWSLWPCSRCSFGGPRPVSMARTGSTCWRLAVGHLRSIAQQIAACNGLTFGLNCIFNGVEARLAKRKGPAAKR
jgi:hypothetical protein